MRIEELEDEVHDLQTSLQELSKDLAVTRSDANNYKTLLEVKQKELETVKDSLTMDSQVRSSFISLLCLSSINQIPMILPDETKPIKARG